MSIERIGTVDLKCLIETDRVKIIYVKERYHLKNNHSLYASCIFRFLQLKIINQNSDPKQRSKLVVLSVSLNLEED